jgi:hypothetical protein
MCDQADAGRRREYNSARRERIGFGLSCIALFLGYAVRGDLIVACGPSRCVCGGLVVEMLLESVALESSQSVRGRFFVEALLKGITLTLCEDVFFSFGIESLTRAAMCVTLGFEFFTRLAMRIPLLVEPRGRLCVSLLLRDQCSGRIGELVLLRLQLGLQPLYFGLNLGEIFLLFVFEHLALLDGDSAPDADLHITQR